MNTRAIGKLISKFCREQSRWLVPVGTAAGVATTAYLASKATLEAVKDIRDYEERKNLPEPGGIERPKKIVELTWRRYISTVVAGASTVGLVGYSSYSMTKRTTAAVTTLAFTEKAFTEYRKAVASEFGSKKELGFAESVTKKQMDENPPSEANVIVMGDKSLTCCETYTGRYFKCDMSTLQKAENEINYLINNELYVTLDEFYDLVGLPHTENSSTLGWNSDRLLSLEYATILYDDTPCLTFRYNYISVI